MASYYDDVPSSPEPGSTDIQDALNAAAIFSSVMNAANIKHCFVGGIACHILGGKRQTEDVDCCVQADWRTIRAVLEAEERFRIPKSKLVSAAMRIYVTVDDGNEVQLDILKTGSGVAPTSLDSIIVNNGLPTLNHLQLISSKLHSFHKRDAQWDGQDIIFLLDAVKYTIDRNQILEEEAEYFLENFTYWKDEVQKAMVKVALLG